jgi:hypothetical protein
MENAPEAGEDVQSRPTTATLPARLVLVLLRAGLDLSDRDAGGEISPHGLAVARGRLENQLFDLAFPP